MKGKAIFYGVLLLAFIAVLGVALGSFIMTGMAPGEIPDDPQDQPPASNHPPAEPPNNEPPQQEPPNNEPQEPDPEPSGITLADVAQHDTAQDCWLVIHDEVYDVTNFIATSFKPFFSKRLIISPIRPR